MSSPRALMSLLFNAEKAIDLVQTSLDLGVLDALTERTVPLGTLAADLGLLPLRLYKLLDRLECLGFVERHQTGERVTHTEYRAVPGARQAAVEVLGSQSQERDRDSYPWRRVHGRLPELLRGQFSMPEEDFTWPLTQQEQIASFERSMSAGLGPIVEALLTNAEHLWPGDRGRRLLDVGGGEGTLAAHLLGRLPHLTVDVYNLPALEPLVARTRQSWGERLGFVGGDFFAEPLPSGYDQLSLVRVLHDWPLE